VRFVIILKLDRDGENGLFEQIGLRAERVGVDAFVFEGLIVAAEKL
jgi:hypothetical protein